MYKTILIVCMFIYSLQPTYSKEREFDNYNDLETYVLKNLNEKNYVETANVLWNTLDKFPEEQHHITNFLLLCYENTHDYNNYLKTIDYSITKDIVSTINPWVDIDSLYQYPHAKELIQANDSIRDIKWKQICGNFCNHNNSNSDSAIKITYIGNCGFLIETINSKILIDAIFTHSKLDSPDSTTLHSMIYNQEPFNRVDIVFVTHIHPDHCNIKLLDAYMQKNQTTILVCPDQILNELKAEYNITSYLNNIIAIKYDTINATDLKINSISIKAFNGNHGGKKYSDINNVNYYIQMDGINVFHSGDSEAAILEKWALTEDFPLQVDIAFLRNIYSSYNLQQQVNSIINADYQVYMHVDDFNRNIIISNLVNDIALYNNPYIFSELNEEVIIEIPVSQ